MRKCKHSEPAEFVLFLLIYFFFLIFLLPTNPEISWTLVKGSFGEFKIVSRLRNVVKLKKLLEKINIRLFTGSTKPCKGLSGTL